MPDPNPDGTPAYTKWPIGAPVESVNPHTKKPSKSTWLWRNGAIAAPPPQQQQQRPGALRGRVCVWPPVRPQRSDTWRGAHRRVELCAGGFAPERARGLACAVQAGWWKCAKRRTSCM
eukprot:894580-Prymnesium_polylepis.1